MDVPEAPRRRANGGAGAVHFATEKTVTIHPELNPQTPAHQRPSRQVESNLLGVYVPSSGLFQDEQGTEFFVTAVEFWDTMTVISLCWKRTPGAGRSGPTLAAMDEHDHELGLMRSWAVGARTIQHFEAVPSTSRALTVRLVGQTTRAELFSCRTPSRSGQDQAVRSFRPQEKRPY